MSARDEMTGWTFVCEMKSKGYGAVITVYDSTGQTVCEYLTNERTARGITLAFTDSILTSQLPENHEGPA